MKAKTTAERQRAFRASLKQQGLTEVRGIFAKPDQHQAVKDAAKKLIDSLATPPASSADAPALPADRRA